MLLDSDFLKNLKNLKNLKPLKLFITATDTHAGKTFISTELLKAFNHLNYVTLGIKPLASGCARENTVLYHQDALLLQKFSSLKAKYEHINPFRFEPAIAPHIAAAQVKQTLSVHALTQKIHAVFKTYLADIYIIEGVGGWCVPLNHQETMADFVKHNHFSVILIINIQLGCLNHAILTYQAIEKTGAPFKGFIANCLSPDIPVREEIIDTLKTMLPIPCLGVIPYQQNL